jgi:hypothetical protein
MEGVAGSIEAERVVGGGVGLHGRIHAVRVLPHASSASRVAEHGDGAPDAIA